MKGHCCNKFCEKLIVLIVIFSNLFNIIITKLLVPLSFMISNIHSLIAYFEGRVELLQASLTHMLTNKLGSLNV